LAQAILAQAILLAWHGRTSALVAMAFADPWVHDDPWKNWRPSVAPTRPSASLAGALPTAIPPPELHAAIELMKATISAGASRQVATAVAAGLWRLATGSVHPRVQDSLPTVLASSSVEREVTARLAALAPSIRAQVAVQAVGAPQRSSSGLVPRDVHVLANAARHLYREGESFEHISPSIARAAQRGFRSHVKVDSEVVPEAAEVSEAAVPAGPSSDEVFPAGPAAAATEEHGTDYSDADSSGAIAAADSGTESCDYSGPTVTPLPSEAFVVEYQKLILDMRADIEGLASAADFKVFDLNVSWVPACGRIDICTYYSGFGPQERHRQVQRAVKDCLLQESASRRLCAHTSWVMQKNQ